MKKLSLIVVLGGLLASNLALACEAAKGDPSPRGDSPKKNQPVSSYSYSAQQSRQSQNQNGAGVDGVYSSAPHSTKRQANQSDNGGSGN